VNLQPRPLQGGLLLVFEGIDGTGKSTQLEIAADHLKTAGWPVLTSRNLGGTPIGEKLREVMLAGLERPPETDLYISVAIQAALIESINQARQAGQIILLDRGPLSLAAYQIFGSGVSGELAWPHVDNGMRQLAPDLTIFYDGDIPAMLDRAKQKADSGDYFESKPLDYFKRVTDGYRQSFGRYDLPIVTIQAGQSIEAVSAASLSAIEKALQAKQAA
jgi:dTMP kinase